MRNVKNEHPSQRLALIHNEVGCFAKRDGALSKSTEIATDKFANSEKESKKVKESK
jgi:hypothetical protein